MNVARLYHTLKFLRFQQVYYRLYYRLKKHWYKPPSDITKALAAANNAPPTNFYNICSSGYLPENNTFRFLNISHSFGEKTDWDYDEYGRLWTYNLNYFNWLNDGRLPVDVRLKTIRDYVNDDGNIATGKEPYPISLRGINWIRFLSRNGIKDDNINACLYRHYYLLAAFPEYHLLANHLLENAFSLYHAAHYFNDKKFYGLARKLIGKQLVEQVLPDGGHYEQSPMYHCILLQRLLQCIELTELSSRFKDVALQKLMKYKAEKMLSWLNAFIFSDGTFAMVSDSAMGIAPAPAQLFKYAQALNIPYGKSTLKECGYRRISEEKYELLIDIGDIMPSYQAGHAHADTFSFCMQVAGKPFVVDTGISTYQKDERRMYERSTEAHNTVVINNQNSSDVWSGHRVGMRAWVKVKEDSDKNITASHNGYRSMGITHERKFTCEADKIVIHDTLKNLKAGNAFFFIHFHPDIVPVQSGKELFMANDVRIILKGIEDASIETYNYCAGYNSLMEAKRIKAKAKEQTEIVFEV